MNVDRISANTFEFRNVTGDTLRWRSMTSTPDKFGNTQRYFWVVLPVEVGQELQELGWTCVSWRNKDRDDPTSEKLPWVKVIIGEFFDDICFISDTGDLVPIANDPTKDVSEQHREILAYLDDIDIDHKRIEYLSFSCSGTDKLGNDRKVHRTAYIRELGIKLQSSYLRRSYGNVEA